jgi:hypothetical protein
LALLETPNGTMPTAKSISVLILFFIFSSKVVSQIRKLRRSSAGDLGLIQTT